MNDPTAGTFVRFGFRGDPWRVAQPGLVRAWLDDVVDSCGMRALGPAQVYEVALEIEKQAAEAFEDEGGVTGVVVLSTSHVAIHCWPARQGLALGVAWSCRRFDPGIVRTCARRHFGAAEVDLLVVGMAVRA